ncbi:MAG: hypothetical protein AABZ60_02680 [Planctomycetota bacterium]
MTEDKSSQIKFLVEQINLRCRNNEYLRNIVLKKPNNLDIQHLETIEKIKKLKEFFENLSDLIEVKDITVLPSIPLEILNNIEKITENTKKYLENWSER